MASRRQLLGDLELQRIAYVPKGVKFCHFMWAKMSYFLKFDREESILWRVLHWALGATSCLQLKADHCMACWS